MTKLISEIGWNHMGDMTLAKEMIHASKENGADFVKFQTWSVDRLTSGPWDEDGRLEIYKKAELSKDQHLELYEYSNTVGIEFFSSVFSLEDADLLGQIQTKYVKIASFESRNVELIHYCLKHFEHLIISTGTSTYDEIRSNSIPYKARRKRLNTLSIKEIRAVHDAVKVDKITHASAAIKFSICIGTVRKIMRSFKVKDDFV